MANQAPITLEQLFRFNRGLPHQLAAISQLEQELLSGKPYTEIMRRDTDWFHTWSQDGKQPAPPTQNHANPLPVPYEYQLDNLSGTGYRECFSSSCAMIAKFYGKVRSDDEYNKIRAKYGDSTDSAAQLRALMSLGLTPKFITNGNAKFLEAEINAGRPVAVGWLHKGPVSRPTGGGHYSVIIGYTKDTFIHNDPNGEADLLNGGYANHTKGKAVAYSRKNWLPRWEVDGNGSGWCLSVRP
jgi:hypothetical protein